MSSKGWMIVDILCNALYPETLYVIQGIFEGLVCLFMMFLVKGIYLYVLKWEEHETEKLIPKKFNDLSSY